MTGCRNLRIIVDKKLRCWMIWYDTIQDGMMWYYHSRKKSDLVNILAPTKSPAVVCHMLLLFGLMTRTVRMCLTHPALLWRSLTHRLREERLLSGECLSASCSARSDQKHWFTTLISKHGPVTQQGGREGEGKAFSPSHLKVNELRCSVFGYMEHQLATKIWDCGANPDNHTSPFFVFVFLMSCWH